MDGTSSSASDAGFLNPRTITKKELVARIADQTGQTKVVAKDIIQAFLDEIIDELGRGNRLEFREFGVFEIQERAARKALNPRTREKVGVPARHVVKFKVGRLMKERVSRISEALVAEHEARLAREALNRPGLDQQGLDRKGVDRGSGAPDRPPEP